MAIGCVVQRGAMIYIYDEHGQQLGSQSGDALLGYTQSSVSIRQGSMIRIFNERGQQIGSQSA